MFSSVIWYFPSEERPVRTRSSLNCKEGGLPLEDIVLGVIFYAINVLGSITGVPIF
jgi:hypothetical protein